MRRGNIALLAGVLLVCGAQANILIDDFTSGFSLHSSSTSTFQTISAGSAIGGFRYTNNFFNTNPLARPISMEVNSAVPGYMFIEAGSGVDGIAVLGWLGNSTPTSGSGGLPPSSFTGFGPIDFSGETGIQIDYINNDQNSTYFYMQMVDNVGNAPLSAVIVAPSGNGSIFLPFASLGGPVDLTQIKGVAVAVGLPNGNDITLTNVEAVPEPATMTILGLGIAGIAARRRRKA